MEAKNLEPLILMLIAEVRGLSRATKAGPGQPTEDTLTEVLREFSGRKREILKAMEG